MPTRKLTAEQVIEGAVALADRIGTDALTIRRIAAEIEVKPMSIYHHVPSKDAIIDGMVDQVFAEIDLPGTTATGARRSWSDVDRCVPPSPATRGRRH